MVELHIVKNDQNEDALDCASEVFDHPHHATPAYLRVYAVLLVLAAFLFLTASVLLSLRPGARWWLEWFVSGAAFVEALRAIRAAARYWNS